MNVPLPLKHLTQQTTQLAVSTSLLAASQTGCFTRDDDLAEGGPDGGDGALVESFRLLPSQAASHAYHVPPSSDNVVVMSADLEDAPRLRPPAGRRTAPRRSTQPVAEAAPDAGPVTDAGPDADADAAPRPRPAPRRERPTRDPVAESYIHSYSSPGLQYGGGRH